MEQLKSEVSKIITAASKGEYHGIGNYLLWDRVKNDLSIAIRDYERRRLVSKSSGQVEVGENCFFQGGHGCGNIRLDVPWKPLDKSGESCPKGGDHKWGIDGQHSNEYCKKCFVPRG